MERIIANKAGEDYVPAKDPGTVSAMTGPTRVQTREGKSRGSNRPRSFLKTSGLQKRDDILPSDLTTMKSLRGTQANLMSVTN